MIANSYDALSLATCLFARIKSARADEKAGGWPGYKADPGIIRQCVENECKAIAQQMGVAPALYAMLREEAQC